ncbi:MAG: LexA repressor [Parcubacteria group bacterium GW2011_GWA2_47_16]|nr:MAG: LexA repressor [Parcubacteria group bacterium GW2011_GWA2_47_16]
MKYLVTARQKELLDVIYEYIRNTGYPPTFEDMRTGLSVSSNQSIVDLLEKLAREGLIRRNESGARNIVILPAGFSILGKPSLVPFLGVTSAGAPIETIEISGEWKELPGNVARLQEEVFVLRVMGDSMINAGIDDGDMVLVQTKKEFVSGEIVLAHKDGEATVKRFISDDKPPYVYLKPENPAYQNILFTDTTQLHGKVISVFKNNYWKPVK